MAARSGRSADDGLAGEGGLLVAGGDGMMLGWDLPLRAKAAVDRVVDSMVDRSGI